MNDKGDDDMCEFGAEVILFIDKIILGVISAVGFIIVHFLHILVVVLVLAIVIELIASFCKKIRGEN